MSPENSTEVAAKHVREALNYPGFTFAFKPRDYQLRSILHCLKSNSLGLGYEMGCGKTFTAISILRTVFVRNRVVVKTLIVCPKIMVETWRRELLAHLHPSNHKFVQTLTGSAEKRLKSFRNPEKRIFIINIDALRIKELYRYLSAYGFRVLILDESHKIKKPTAQRTELLLNLCESIDHVLALSGTPVLNTLLDIWSQLRILKVPEIDPSFFSFQHQYFYDENLGMPPDKYYPSWVPRPEKEKELLGIIAKHWHFVKAKDVLDLPPIIQKTIYVDLEGDQLKHYREMESDFVTYLSEAEESGAAVVADIALTKLLRMQEITSGILSLDSGEVVATKKNAKLEPVEELLKEHAANHKIAIWACFRASYEPLQKVCEKLNLPYVMIVGGQSDAERTKAVDAFNNDPRVRVVIANQSAASLGIGLQSGSVVIYFSKRFSLEEELQSIKRFHRGGSEIHKAIYRFDIVAMNTIDEYVNESLANKEKLGALVTNFKRRKEIGK